MTIQLITKVYKYSVRVIFYSFYTRDKNVFENLNNSLHRFVNYTPDSKSSSALRVYQILSNVSPWDRVDYHVDSSQI